MEKDTPDLGSRDFATKQPAVSSSANMMPPSHSGDGIDSTVSHEGVDKLKAPSLGTITSSSVDGPITGDNIGGSIFKFADDFGDKFGFGIKAGSIAPAIEHEFSEAKGGLANISGNKQLGAEKGLSQGIVGNSQGG